MKMFDITLPGEMPMVANHIDVTSPEEKVAALAEMMRARLQDLHSKASGTTSRRPAASPSESVFSIRDFMAEAG